MFYKKNRQTAAEIKKTTLRGPNAHYYITKRKKCQCAILRIAKYLICDTIDYVMNYVNAHCHLSSDALPLDVAVAITNAARVVDWANVVQMSGRGGAYGAIGIHPWYVSVLPRDWAARMRKFLVAHPKLMVGEIGLDKNHPDMPAQMDVFRAQLEMARELGRVAHIHCVGAWDKVLSALSEITPPAIVLHDFAASPEIMKDLLRYNSYFSFGRAICNPRRTRAINALRVAPRNRMLSESDTSAPSDVIGVVEKMAEILGAPLADVKNTVYNNAIKLLKI